jgi:hypothetical protein
MNYTLIIPEFYVGEGLSAILQGRWQFSMQCTCLAESCFDRFGD